MQIETIVHARAGLLGNPSDGYYGKTISCLVGNFAARVVMEEHDSIRLLPHAHFDQSEFSAIDELADTYLERGYYGGMRLLQAACKRFVQQCRHDGIKLHGPNFTLRYDTDIPQQVGLSGSSAIVIATLRALLRWYGVEGKFKQQLFPALALAVEAEELKITAGLQDRVIQTYGGLVYMDFAAELQQNRGYGEYLRLDPATLPPLFLAYVLDPSDSGAIHSDVRRRWHEGDQEVHAAMERFASFAESGRELLSRADHGHFSSLMNEAFLLRRKIFGDAVLGPDNLRMVALANNNGLNATTCGSGGAIVGVMGDDEQNNAFAAQLAAEGYRYMPLRVGPEYPWGE